MAAHPTPDPLTSNTHVPGAGSHAGQAAGIDRSQETYRPSPYAARRTLPHGDVSRDGTRAWPQPSMTSRVVVYGGAAIVAAAVTAGGVLAVRKVADMISGNDEIDRDADHAADRARDRVYRAAREGRADVGPRPSALTEREREAMRARARAKVHHDEGQARGGHDEGRSHLPGTAKPRRPRSQPSSLGLMGDIEHTAQRLTGTISDVVNTVSSAMAAFRAVAGQAEGVMREFSRTADQIRGFLDAGGQGTGGHGTAAAPSRDQFRRPARRDVVDLRDDGAPNNGATDDTARTHRL